MRLVDEVLRVFVARNRGKRARTLIIVEHVADRRGANVGSLKAAEIKVLLDILKNAAELVLRVSDVTAMFAFAGDGVTVRGRASARGSRGRRSHLGKLLRHGVVVKSAPIVPQHDDDARVPVLALADRVDHAGNPLRALIETYLPFSGQDGRCTRPPESPKKLPATGCW